MAKLTALCFLNAHILYTCVLIASVIFSAAGRQSEQVAIIEAYLRASGLFRDYSDPAQDPAYSSVVQLDLASVVPSLSGPKRPHDRVSVSDMKEDFQSCLDSRVLGGEGGGGFQVGFTLISHVTFANVHVM